jgi:predicted ATPase
LVDLAESDPVKEALAQRALGSTYMNRGAFDAAVAAFNRCIASYGAGANAAGISDRIEAPTIIALQYKGFVRCVQGRVEEGLDLIDQAVAHARKLRHALALAFALHVNAVLFLLARDYERSRERATEALALATEHRLVFWIAGSKLILGCASVHMDASSDGLEVSREGVREWRATGAALYVPMWLSLIADAALTTGEVESARAAVADAMTTAKNDGDVLALADLQRLSGEIAIRRGEPDLAKAQLELAIGTATEQGAHLYGLRAAVSLSQLLRIEGRKDEARRVLEAVMTRFTESENFVDLLNARRFLADC